MGDKMHNNAGRMIGFYRNKSLEATKSQEFTQKLFSRAKNRIICSQSKLSLIENGRIELPYLDEYQSLITKLGRHFIDYNSIKQLYVDFTNQLLKCIQYQTSVDLKEMDLIFERDLKKYNDFFYLREVNDVFQYTFDVLLDRSLIDVNQATACLDMIDCFPDEVKVLILNLVLLVIENYSPSSSMITHYNSQINTLQLDNCPLLMIMKANLKIRQLKIIKAQKELHSLMDSPISNLLKYRAKRLLYALEVQHEENLEKASLIQNPSAVYSDVNRFERYRSYLPLAYYCYDHGYYEKALFNYQHSVSINPESSCFSMIFICDCMLELNQNNELPIFLSIVKQSLNRFSLLHTFVHSFFTLYISENKKDLTHFNFSLLFSELSKLHSDSPYISIIRKYLLKYIDRVHTYKLLYDFEMAIKSR